MDIEFLSNAISIEIITRISFLVCKKMLGYFRMLNPPCIPGINSALVVMYVPVGSDFQIFY